MSTPEEDFHANDSRIVFVFHRGDVLGGASVYIMHMAKALVDQGHGVHVLVAGEGHFAQRLAQSGISWSSIPPAGQSMGPATALRGLRLVPRLKAELDRLDPTLVSAQGAQASVLVRLLRGRLTCPVVYTPHGWSFMPGSGARNRVFGRLIEYALRGRSDATIAVSQFEADVGLKARAVNRNKLHVILNGVPDIGVSNRPARESAECVNIVCVARFERQKDHTALIEAADLIRDLPFQIALIGEGNLEESVRDHVSRLGLEDRIVFQGPTDDIASALRGAEVFVLPSHWESFPLSILEAMSAECAIVATDVGGVSEAIADGVSGLLVPRGDAEALARALRRVVGDDIHRRILAKSGRTRFERHFRIEAMTEPTVALYEQLSLPSARRRIGSH